MHTLDGYRSTHTQLRQMIDDLRALLTTERLRIHGNAKAAHARLCDLGERVHKHLAEEDRGLYPDMLIHEDPKVKSIAWGFISGQKPLRKIFADYQTRWLTNRECNFSGPFLADTHGVFAIVGQRIDHEEQFLLPKLVEIGMLRETRHSRGSDRSGHTRPACRLPGDVPGSDGMSAPATDHKPSGIKHLLDTRSEIRLNDIGTARLNAGRGAQS